jgi:transcription antitermination factor NusG
MDLVCEFNQAIERANEVNRVNLITLESLKAKIALYEQAAEKCRAFKGYEYEYPDNRKSDWSGEMVKVFKEPLVDQKAVVETLNALKKEKNALEDKLSRSNGEVTVDFDVDRVLAVL